MRIFFLIIGLILAVSCVSTNNEGVELPYLVQDDLQENIEGDVQTYELQFYQSSILRPSDRLYVRKATQGGQNWYYLAVYYRGDNWRFMKSNLILQADDSILNLSGSDPDRKVLYKEVSEFFYIQVTPEVIALLANAKVARIQYWKDVITLSDKTKALLNRFAQDYAQDKSLRINVAESPSQ